VAVDYIYGLSSTDGRYVMSGRRTPKYRIYIADARTGAVQDSIDVSEAGYIGRCEVVGDDYWVYSRHRKMMRTISRSDTAKRRWFRMPALGVVSMALAGQTMWQSNVQPRSITRTRLDGRLIEWAESPFERFSHLASDGRSLWALDATNSRVCRLERI